MMRHNLLRLLALLIFIILSPILLIISLKVKKEMGSPILFKQERAGLHGIPFYIYKFRSMTNETDETGKLLPGYQRITTFGNFLRKSSLDELPQLINVIKGELTLVGPRPLHVEYNQLYNEHQKKRLDVKPGITGLAQINGRNNISWEEKFNLDVEYVEKQNIFFDMMIILKTVIKVFKRDGINPDNQKETPRFKGGSYE